jgi:CBS domain-containing protein
MAQHRALSLLTFDRDSVVHGPGNEPWQVDLAETAKTVMTDFRERSLFKFDDIEKVDDALQRMKHAGLRAAFVMDKASDRVLGMITAYDILGEKPLRYIESLGPAGRGMARRDLRVADLMEKVEAWTAADMREIEQATVHSVLDAMKKGNLTHLPVMESADGGKQRLRGLFSWSKILRLTEASRKRNPASGI